MGELNEQLSARGEFLPETEQEVAQLEAAAGLASATSGSLPERLVSVRQVCATYKA